MRIETHPVIDFHGPSNGCGERLRLLTAQRKATCVKAIDAGGWAFEAAKLRRESGVPHVVVFRQSAPGDLGDDHPDLNLAPEQAAEKLWRAILATMPPELVPFRDIIYIEPTNEPGVVTAADKQEQARWIGAFCVAIAKKMLAEGWNPALAGFNAGTPSQEQVRLYFADLLRLFADNWERCLWTLHEAKLGGYKPGLDYETRGLEPFVPDLVNSSQRMFAVCDELGIRRPRTFISEFAWSHNDIPDAAQFRAEVAEACRMDAAWPEVVGRVIYTTHAGGTMWGRLRNKLNEQSPWLTEFVTGTTLAVEAAGRPVSDARTIRAHDRSSMVDQAEAAGFAASVDLVNSTLAPGTSYDATWTFKNSGETTWDGTYRFVYSEDAHPQTAAMVRRNLAGRDGFTLTEIGAPGAVRPGETVSLTVSLTTPDAPGTYASNWQLQAPDGGRFGPVRWTAVVVAGGFDGELLRFQNSVTSYEDMQPGQQFSGTWVLRNSGNRAWPGDTRLAYVTQHRPETEGRALAKLGAKERYTLREVSGRDQVAPGEQVTVRLDFIAPQQPGQYAYHWQLEAPNGKPFGGLRWMGIGVAAPVGPRVVVTPPATGQTEFGMNVNINGGHGLDVERIRGLGWVRFVYWATRRQQSPEEAYSAHYRQVIQAYASAGIKSLLVLHQDTEWGNGPWDSGDWETYAELYARACGRVARACAEFRDSVAYQIFNETDSGFGDDAPFHNPSAIGLPPEAYALILDKAAAAIRAVDPQATIVLGGLKTGPNNAVNYLKRVAQRLGGRLPVDALACHPYGRFVDFAPFNFGQIGRLGDSIAIFRQAFPKLPLWITEIGVPGHQTVLGPEHYPTIARYMDEVVREVAEKHAEAVPVVMWFAWSDVSENAGIVTTGGAMKPQIADAYRTMIEYTQAARAKDVDLEELLKEFNSEFLRFESTLENHNAVPAGSSFTNRWTFRNTGAAAWGEGCHLVYAPKETDANGAPMGERTSYELAEVAAPMPAQPNEEVTVTLNLTAPEKFGRVYTSRWELRSPDDQRMGFLYAEITVVPAPTAGTRARKPDMAYVADKTITDGTRLTEGMAFDKQWLVRNSGDRHWGDGFRLIGVDGDRQMALGNLSHLVPPAAPGEEVILNVPMTAPPARNRQPTVFQSTWRLQDDHGNYFGEPLWVKIVAVPAQAQTSFNLFSDPTGWYSQKDPRWAGHQLGHGAQTIGSWGCLLTCFAMMLTAYGAPVTPVELNQRLKEAAAERGFQGSSVQFVAPTDHLPGLIMRSNFRSWAEPEIPSTYWQEGVHPIQRIDDALDGGHAVLAQVDYDRNDANIDQHWVIITQRTPAGDDYNIIDPFVTADQVANQPLSLMSLYGKADPGRTHEDNLRDAIKSALVFNYNRQGSGG